MENEIRSTGEKQLMLMKLQTGILAGILVIILVFTLFCAVKLSGVVEMAASLDLEQVNGAVSSLKSAADNLASVDTDAINQGIQGLSDAAADLEELDVTKLNRFMTSLDNVADQLDAASEVLKGIFGKR